MKLYHKHIIPALLLLFIMCQPTVSSDVVTSNTKVDSLMQHMYKNGMFNGTVLVTENGEITYKNAFGLADREENRELTTTSRFYLASVSKQFTCMGIMILKEKGLLSYDDTLHKYFPEFPDFAKNITIRHMMNHTSGIPDHYRLNAYKKGLTNNDVLEVLLNHGKLDFQPGERYSYSNGGYVLLSMIAAKASGQPFSTFMKEHIFDKLEMNNTLVFDESDPQIENRAKGYNALNSLDDYEIFTTGAGGMYSNVNDLYTWDQALYTEKLVSFETMIEAFSPAELNNGETSPYGFGWGINRDGEKLIVNHSGGMNGYRTFIRRYVDDKKSYILLSNNGDAIEMGGLNNALNSILSGKDFTLPKAPLTNIVQRKINESDVETAIEHAKRLLQEKPDYYNKDENGMNALGYSIIDENLEGALAIFKFNTELHPDASNVYDSYGEALLKKGDTLAAIENYKKSIVLNPNNANGIDILTKTLGLDASEVIPKISVAEETLQTYVGKYQLNPNFALEVLREGNRLFVLPTGQSKSEVFAASETRFYSKIVNAQITFKVEDNGSVSGLTLHQGGNTWAQKVE